MVYLKGYGASPTNNDLVSLFSHSVPLPSSLSLPSSSVSADLKSSSRVRGVVSQDDSPLNSRTVAGPTPIGTIPIRGIQKMMFKSMTTSKEIPHLTLGDEVVVDNLVKTREALKETAAKLGLKLTYLPFFVKSVSIALLQYPLLNSSISSDFQSVVVHSQHNIGVAMDSPKGLVVPVIKDIQRKSIMDIAAELGNLQASASVGKLSETQLSGATFSLSNIGSIAGTYAVPVVVPPQVGIGAIGKFQVLPRYVTPAYGKEMVLVPTTVMNVSWSADHRIIDGATVAKFSKVFASYLTDPVKLMAELH